MCDPAAGSGDHSADPAAPQALKHLYHQAFRAFGVTALWNLREIDDPTPAEALAITRQLRVEGDMRARRLAESIERACRAHL